MIPKFFKFSSKKHHKYKSKNDFPDIEIVLITHSSDFCIKETMEFGGVTREVAEKIENIWQDIMKDDLLFSSKTKYK